MSRLTALQEILRREPGLEGILPDELFTKNISNNQPVTVSIGCRSEQSGRLPELERLRLRLRMWVLGRKQNGQP
jgi:hypothetical protein